VSDRARASLILDAAAIGVPLDDWLALPRHTRDAVVDEHNRRITDRE
jgi:hypothetical protein